MTWRCARNLAVFLFCGTVPSLWLAGAAPRPFLEDYTSKLATFEADPQGFDVLVLGSSRVHRGFDPEVFDRTMQSGGVEVRSFNLGVRGAFGHEWNALLPEVLARAKRPLKWVLIELNPPDENYRVDGLSDRMTHWHSPLETLRVLRSVALAEMETAERLDLYRAHLLFGLIHNYNVGSGPRLLARALGRVQPPELVGQRGWAPLSELNGPNRERNARVLRQSRAFGDRESRSSWNSSRQKRESILPELATEKVRMIESVGSRAALIIMPYLGTTPQFEGEADVTLLRYNDPKRLLDLFVAKNFYEPQHLWNSGAREFSRLLALDLLESLKEK